MDTRNEVRDRARRFPAPFNPGAEDAPVGKTNLCIPQTAGEAADYALLAKRVRRDVL